MIIAATACQAPKEPPPTNNAPAATVPAAPPALKMHPDYPNIPLAERGITVVSKKGWDKQTMDFHRNYCSDMLASLDSIDRATFCDCFLDKIQYYYEPIYFKEAYEDQKIWNQYCLAEAKKAYLIPKK